MYVLESHIRIGDLVFNQVTDVSITKSVDDLADTATITLPASFKVRQSGEELYTEEAVKIGDRVEITLGYENVTSNLEFSGYVAKVSSGIPLKIKCEDAIWLLRRKNITRAWNKGVSLKTLLKELLNGTGIEPADNLPDIQLEKLVIKDANIAQVLEQLVKDYGLTIYITDGEQLYCGLQQLEDLESSVGYDLNYHLVENKLEYMRADERRLKVKYTHVGRNNQRTTVEVGDEDGELRTFHTTVVSDRKKLEEMATAELAKLKHDGFDGSFKVFLAPYVTRGTAVELEDSEHPNRSGNYFVEEVKTTFGSGGARRTIKLGSRI